MNDISRFLDKDLKVKTWPSKMEVKLDILKYVSTKFECGKNYTEKDVNSIINAWHTFGDYFMIRRGLIDAGLLTRTRNGASYWKEEEEEEEV